MTTRDRFGAHALGNPYELIDDVKLNQIGLGALQGIAHLLAELTRDAVTGVPRTGFVGDEGRCVPGAGALDVTVSAGVGWVEDSADTAAFGLGYKPIVLASSVSLTLDPHDSAHPRVDLVVARPATADLVRVSRTVFDVSSGGPVTASLDSARRSVGEVDVLTGTPGATPAEPTVPAGWTLLARVDVPAVSGTVTITDRRPLLGFGHAWAPPPARGYARPHVVARGLGGAAGEGEVTATGTSLVAFIASADVWIFGMRRRIAAQQVTLTASGVATTRGWISVNSAGAVVVTSSTSGLPTRPAAFVNLASFKLSAGAVALGSADLTDERAFEAYSGDQLQAGTVAASRMQRVPVALAATVGAEVSPSPDEAAYSEITVDCQLTDADGNPIALEGAMGAALQVRVELLYTDPYSPQTPSISAPASFAGGSPVQGIGKTLLAGTLMTLFGPLGGPSTSTLYMVPSLVARPNLVGELSFKVYDGAGINRSLALLLTPLNWPGHPTLVELPFRP
jgi:hypothetical protein